MDPVEYFDHLILFRNSELLASYLSEQRTQLDPLLDNITEVLSEALKDRTTFISRTEIPTKIDSLSAIGIRLIGPTSLNIMTKGPVSESDAGKDFRAFWNEKSELRRVDGDLYECVLWKSGENVVKQIVDYFLHERFRLPRGSPTDWTWYQITPDRLKALLTVHPVNLTKCFEASSLRLIRSMDKLRSLLRGLNEKLPLNVTGISPVSSAFRDTAVFPPILTVPSASIRKVRRRKATSVENSPDTSIVFPVFPLYVVVTLEQSGKWPNELLPFQHMKRLLVIRIHELLSPLSIPSRVARNNTLDIFLDGLVFRVFISLPREAKLLESDASISTKTIQDTEERGADLDKSFDASSIANLAAHVRLTQSMPTISGLLTSVTRDHPHVFPDACRLAKRWLSSHGYPVIMCPFEAEFDGIRHVFLPAATKPSKSHHSIHSDMSSLSIDLNPLDSGARLSEIAVELLLVYAAGFSIMIDQKNDSISGTAHLKPGPLCAGPTGSPLAAFLRFLKLLALHDWERHPLLVDLNDGFSDLAKRRVACDALQGNRGRLPAMVICTPVDPLGTEWTTIGPTRAGLSTLQALALQSHSLLRAMLVAGARIQDLKAIFRPCHKNLNLVMLLKQDISRVRALEAVDFLPSTRSLKRKAANESAPPDEIPPPGAAFWPMGYCYDPMALFVQLLKFRLGKFCELRWDRHGGSWIGLKWNANMVAKSVFSNEVLDGLVVHKQCGTQMFVVHQPSSLVALLPHWGQRFVHSVQVVNSEIIPEPHSTECDIPKKKQKKKI